MAAPEKRDWSAYNKAKVHEQTNFGPLLHELCAGIVEPNHPFGRPALPLADMLFAMAFKVYRKNPCREFMGDLGMAHNSGFISKLPSFNSLFHYFEMEMVTPYLRQLIIESSKALSDIETVFAVDSTGFSIKSLGSWIDTRFEKDKVRGKRAWIKVHIMCGVLTNIITAVEISKGTAGDCPYLKLLYKVTALHFCIKEVLGDKAYSSLENLRLVSNNGGILFCPFKINAKAEHRTKDPLWAMLYHLFSMYPEWFKRHYHKRSNVESTFSAIKRKFGEFLRSRTETAQVNEALCKVLCHNLCVINQCMYQMGLEPMFWKEEKIDRAKAS
jgi:transposase